MIGMVAFVMDIPEGFTDPATVLPVQIFLWIDSQKELSLRKLPRPLLSCCLF